MTPALSHPASLIALRRMRLVAGALLVAMAGLYALALYRPGGGAGWSYVAAFAEAAMVGGLADWFAVTALFRRPLGLPIPHTGVIPNNKARIADAIGEFVSVNFLAPDVLRARLAAEDISGALARQLTDPDTARRIADGTADALPALIDLFDDATVAEFLKRQMRDLGRGAKLSSAMGEMVRFLTVNGRHQPLIDAVIREAWTYLEKHGPDLRDTVRARTGFLWRAIGLDKRASDAMIAALEDTLIAMAGDPDHPVRVQVTTLIRRFADDLQNDPQMQKRIEEIIADALGHPGVETYLAGVWNDIKREAQAIAAAPDHRFRGALAEAILRGGQALRDDLPVRETLNVRLRALFVELASRHGADAGRIITETIKSWDTETIVSKIEQGAGPDLQFIRINGTLIGGCIGLLIHQITLWMGHG
jgi:uncharacterized membrane-anchored protein YjiN (DUF445 family)